MQQCLGLGGSSSDLALKWLELAMQSVSLIHGGDGLNLTFEVISTPSTISFEILSTVREIATQIKRYAFAR